MVEQSQGGAPALSGDGLATLRSLTIRNYRTLRDVSLTELTPLTVLFGPNGSGKSTVLDAMLLIKDVFSTNLETCLDYRGGLQSIRSFGATGPVVVEFTFRDDAPGQLTYRLELEESRQGDDLPPGDAVIAHECVKLALDDDSDALSVLEVSRGEGFLLTDGPDGQTVEEQVRLDGPDILATDVFGRLGRPHAARVRRFVRSWRHSVAGLPRREPDFRAVPRLGAPSGTPWIDPEGGLVGEYVAYLQHHAPAVLRGVLDTARAWIPQLAEVEAVQGADGRHRLGLRDEAFEEKVDEYFISDGTMHVLTLLLQLRATEGPALLLFEEPELLLHPRLHLLVAEELRRVSSLGGVIATTHSPHLADALSTDELWLIHRERDGFARVLRASEEERVVTMARAGGQLGDLWMEGWFGVGDPLSTSQRSES